MSRQLASTPGDIGDIIVIQNAYESKQGTLEFYAGAGSQEGKIELSHLSEFEFHGLNPYSSMNVVFKNGVSYKVLKKEVIDNKIYVTVKYLGNIDTPSTVTKSSTVNSKPELPSEKIKLPYIKPETKVDLTPEAKVQVKDAVQNIRNNYGASFDQI